jgi:glycosyltransferase involved in cell wall biosynthesis
MMVLPELTIIVPAYNSAGTMGPCLASIFSQAGPDVEVIVADDGSTDDTHHVASHYPARLVVLPANLGAAAARNRAAQQALGRVLFFVDSDVTLSPGALARVRAAIQDPELEAVIGSYDDAPADMSLISQFKNLAHHYLHQHSGPDAKTLFGACTVIRRDLFLAFGGFDERKRWLEDVELGYRLSSRGVRIRLDRELQVKHLKRWTLCLLLRTDVTRRAIPWAALWLEYGWLPKDLNFGLHQRAAAVIAVAMGALAGATIFQPLVLIPLAWLLMAAAWINRGLYSLFFRRGGVRLMVGGLLLQQLYYIYCTIGLVAAVAVYPWPRLRPLMYRL